MKTLGEISMSHRERDDNYRGDVVTFENFRVAVCRDGIQWLLQRRRGGEWRTCGYFLTRKALILDWRRYFQNEPTDLKDFPKVFRR